MNKDYLWLLITIGILLLFLSPFIINYFYPETFQSSYDYGDDRNQYEDVWGHDW